MNEEKGIEGMIVYESISFGWEEPEIDQRTEGENDHNGEKRVGIRIRMGRRQIWMTNDMIDHIMITRYDEAQTRRKKNNQKKVTKKTNDVLLNRSSIDMSVND